jgi:hypothetical protein
MAPNQSLDSDFFTVISFYKWPQHIMCVLSPFNSEIKIERGKNMNHGFTLGNNKEWLLWYEFQAKVL